MISIFAGIDFSMFYLVASEHAFQFFDNIVTVTLGNTSTNWEFWLADFSKKNWFVPKLVALWFRIVKNVFKFVFSHNNRLKQTN